MIYCILYIVYSIYNIAMTLPRSFGYLGCTVPKWARFWPYAVSFSMDCLCF